MYPITELLMKKIAIALCIAWLTVMPEASLQAQMVVPKAGDPLPTLTLNYLGKQPELNGKPVLVEFWATWCPPCRKSIPHLNEIYSKYKAQGLEIVGITDEDAATLTQFPNQIPMHYNLSIQ